MMPQAERQQGDIAYLLELHAAQAQAALSEVDLVAEGLTSSFTDFKKLIDEAMIGLTDTLVDSESALLKKEMGKDLTNAAMVQLQSFDRTVQRLSHLRDSLLMISDNMNLETKQGELEHRVRTFYSLAHEVELHDLAAKGSSRDKLFNHALNPHPIYADEESADELF